MATKKNKVYEGATAPQDTSLFWVKTRASRDREFDVYRYKNGQWIQMSEDAAAIVMQIADDADAADVYTKEETDEKYAIAESMRKLFLALGAEYNETSGKYTLTYQPEPEGSDEEGGDPVVPDPIVTEYTYEELIEKFISDNSIVLNAPQS